MKDDGWRMMDDGWIWELLSLKVELYRQTDGRTDIQTDKQLPLFITLTDLILVIATDFSHTINTSSTSLISIHSTDFSHYRQCLHYTQIRKPEQAISELHLPLHAEKKPLSPPY
jgi:predicted class III extradiol MEMO1 family dioxygenase